MASLKERLNDNEYKLWIKAGLCLNYTKEGIGRFTDDRCKKTHAFVKTAVEKRAIVKNPDGDIKAMNKICDNAKIVKRGNRWSLGCCNDCDIYVKQIAKLWKPPSRIELSNWCNSEVQLWPSKPWEIAKVFMSKGQWNAKETDLSGLLNFIDHCHIPWVDIDNKDSIKKVREARNATMHSASMKMSNADFLVYTDAMIALLQDPLFMDKIEEAQNAVKEIQKIVQIDFVISATDEFRILTNKTSSLQEQNDRLQDEVNALKIKHTDLENASSQSEETTRILVKKETNQREAAIDTLKAEISEKENQLKEISVEIDETARSLVKTETGQREAAINNLKAEISEKEKQLKEIIIEIDETARSLVKTETGKREAAINNLKAEISEKEKQLKELSTELMLVKKIINKDRNLYRKMDIRVSNVETSCDKTASELKKVKQSHQGLVEQVQRIQHIMQISDFSILDSKNRTPLDEVELLNEKLTETQHELWCRNKELEEYRLSTVSEKNIIVQDKTYLVTAEKAKKELAAANEKLTAEVKQLQSELRQTKERGIEKECTKTTCTSRIEALEYSNELLKSENESLRSTYDMKKLNANLRAFEERNDNLEAQLANANLEREKSDTFIEALQTMNTQNEKQIQGLSRDINKLSTEKDSLNVKKAKLEVDLRRKEDENQCLMQENIDLKATGEDLSRKLTTSLQHEVDLERKLSATNASIQNFERTSKESTQEMDKMKSDLYKLNNSHEEVKQRFSEAQEIITSKTSECNRLEHTVEDLQRRLETTEKQLSSQNEKSKQSLEVVILLKQERDELAGQVKQIPSLTDEREQMISRQHELESTIKELQRKIEVGDKSRSAVAETAQKTKEELHTQAAYEKSSTRYSTQRSSAEERPTRKPRQNITNLSARKLRSIEIKVKDDKKACFIRGMALTNNGTILLADWENSNIKSVSPDSKVLSVLSLPSFPRAITVLDTTTAVATAFDDYLYIINIIDNKALSLRSKSQLDYMICAMVTYNGNLAVTCDTSPVTTKLITIGGRVLWSVCRDTTGPNLFDRPRGITITSITDTTAAVVVSDKVNNTLTLLEAQTGTFIRSIDVGKKKWPWGITTDSDGNVYVCYLGENEIGVWSADFQESKILLSGEDQLGERPGCIVYNTVDDSLYVSYDNYSRSRNTVDSFRLV